MVGLPQQRRLQQFIGEAIGVGFASHKFGGERRARARRGGGETVEQQIFRSLAQPELGDGEPALFPELGVRA